MVVRHDNQPPKKSNLLEMDVYRARMRGQAEKVEKQDQTHHQERGRGEQVEIDQQQEKRKQKA